MPGVEGFEDKMNAMPVAPQAVEDKDLLADNIGEDTDAKLDQLLKSID